MSDLQDLIHKTSMDCIERGKIVERERIIKLLSAMAEDCDNGICNCLSAQSTIELIRGNNDEEA
jgi:hypothetical protein